MPPTDTLHGNTTATGVTGFSFSPAKALLPPGACRERELECDRAHETALAAGMCVERRGRHFWS
jgi:hypothetical protein